MQFPGFYELYQIDVRDEDNEAESDRAKQKGLKSLYGHRGAICAHFGWTWDYLQWGVTWNIVQRMMIDAPSYEYKDDDEKKKGKDLKLKKTNVKDIANYINSINR